MGVVASGFTYSHEVFGEGFYMADVLVKRLSNSNDRIPLMISERLIDVTQDYTGEAIKVSGQFRSYNRHEEQKNRLVLSVFVREVEFIDEELDGAKTNHILPCLRHRYRAIDFSVYASSLTPGTRRGASDRRECRTRGPPIPRIPSRNRAAGRMAKPRDRGPECWPWPRTPLPR